MYRKIVMLALAGLLFGAAATLFAAPGDMDPSSAYVDTGLKLTEFCINATPGNPPYEVFRWRDGRGRIWEAIVTNTRSQGFDYADGSSISLPTAGLFTTVRTDLGITNAKIQAAVQSLKTAAIVVMPGTVQSN